jgi:CRISPR-associated endonuclease/helicase Cas3
MEQLHIMKRPENLKCFYGDVSHRHRLALLEDTVFDTECILEAGKSKKVLVIVNTVSAAQRLYAAMVDRGVSVWLLHSMFLKKDRKQLEEAILAFAPNNLHDKQAGIWISTQIVEASLDIDFDVLYTEMCPVDQLLQRMGRVYRSRDYFGEEPNIYVLNNRNGVSGNKNGIIASDLYDLSLAALIGAIGDADSILLEECQERDIKQELINYVYGDKIKGTGYYKRIQEQLKLLEALPLYELDKRETDKLFRDIDSITLIPKCVYEASKEKIDMLLKQLNINGISNTDRQKVKDQLSNFTVSVSYYKGLDIDLTRELYPHSGIYFYNGKYDFDEEKIKGVGLIKQYKKSADNELMVLIF